MTYLIYFIIYILGSFVLAFLLKKYKSKPKKVSYIKRKKENDYMNNPKFSYMTCNKHNPKSPFFNIDKQIEKETPKDYIYHKSKFSGKNFIDAMNGFYNGDNFQAYLIYEDSSDDYFHSYS